MTCKTRPLSASAELPSAGIAKCLKVLEKLGGGCSRAKPVSISGTGNFLKIPAQNKCPPCLAQLILTGLKRRSPQANTQDTLVSRRYGSRLCDQRLGVAMNGVNAVRQNSSM